MMPTNKLPIYIKERGFSTEWLWVASIDNRGPLPSKGDYMDVDVWLPGVGEELTQRTRIKGFVVEISWYNESVVLLLEAP